MDATKKRKAEENGVVDLSPEDARKILEPFTRDQLLEILQEAAINHFDVLDAVRSIADRDVTQRKLFIRGLGWDTTTDGLRTIFSAYGQLEEAVVILDKATGKSKGYGFITFKHIDGAINALKEPSKKIDGRMTVTQLAVSGNQPTATAHDVSARKIFVGNVPIDMPADRLLAHFSQYGEIEEGPLGYDKQTGKSRGYALFVYKTEEAASKSLIEPNKVIDCYQLLCKLALDGKKGKPGVAEGISEMQAAGLAANTSIPVNPGGIPYGGVTGYGSVGIHPGHLPHAGHIPLNPTFPASINPAANPGITAIPTQVPSSLASGYGAGLSAGGYGVSQYGGSQYGDLGTTAGGLGTTASGVGSSGYGTMAGAAAMYRMPQASVSGGGSGVPVSGVYPEAGHYGLSSGLAYPSQLHQPSGTSAGPRIPSGGMYQNNIPPPYF